MSNPVMVYDIKRHDSSLDRSLRPYSAADEYIMQEIGGLSNKPSHTAIYNDRFGFLSCHLHAISPIVVLTKKSQEKAIDLNLKANKLPLAQFSNPLSDLKEKVDFAIVKVPKSLALFELFLQHISQNATKDVTVVIAFMTRHFTPKLIEIAGKYFEEVKQSRAVKKSRLATLTKKKEVPKVEPIDILDYNDQVYKQYWGVFSAKHIDYATQFFMKHIDLKPTDHMVLDLASGNGVIAKEVLLQMPTAEIHLIDDSYLAVESGKLNIAGENIHHHFDNDLSSIEEGTLDLIVTNPPFHFEYEININVAIQLFKECFKRLKDGGNLQVVASSHLNYLTHLQPIFSSVSVLAENDKFIIYKCVKTE